MYNKTILQFLTYNCLTSYLRHFRQRGDPHRVQCSCSMLRAKAAMKSQGTLPGTPQTRCTFDFENYFIFVGCHFCNSHISLRNQVLHKEVFKNVLFQSMAGI